MREESKMDGERPYVTVWSCLTDTVHLLGIPRSTAKCQIVRRSHLVGCFASGLVGPQDRIQFLVAQDCRVQRAV